MTKKLIRELDDPSIDEIKISSSDHFELVYLRHRYFRKSTNPSPERLAQFEEMICKISDKIYLRNIEIFKTVGFEMDDLRNIARVHTVSFISMGGLAENPDLMKKFVLQHKKQYGMNSDPDEMDIFRKEAYNLARFLDQRIQEVAKFSKNKNQNIRGTKNHKRFFIGDGRNNPDDLDLFRNPELYGYEKITESKYKDLVSKNHGKGKSHFLTEDGQMVRAVYIKGSFLTEHDIEDTQMDSRRTTFYRSPEENLMMKELIFENQNKKLYKNNR